jgi:hypothetical protein
MSIFGYGFNVGPAPVEVEVLNNVNSEVEITVVKPVVEVAITVTCD